MSVALSMAAAAFVGSLTLLIASIWIPYVRGSARSFVVGTGAMLAAFVVAGLWEWLNSQVERERWDTRPLVTVHPRRRG
jgi:uncharacterized membrane protein